MRECSRCYEKTVKPSVAAAMAILRSKVAKVVCLNRKLKVRSVVCGEMKLSRNSDGAIR